MLLAYICLNCLPGQVDSRTGEVLPTVDNPLEDGYDDDDCERSDTIIYIVRYTLTVSRKELTHVTPRHRKIRREHKEHRGQCDVTQSNLDRPISSASKQWARETDYISGPSQSHRQPPSPLRKCPTASNAIDADRNGIRKIQGDHRRGDNGIESTTAG